MEILKKHRIIRWLNIFLLIINLSALITLLVMNGKTTPRKEHVSTFSSDIFLRNKLHLSDEQFQSISEYDAKIFRVYQSLLDMQCEMYFEVFDELLLEEPSRAKLDSLVQVIGRLHSGLQRQTIKHFLNVKSVCNPEQKELLDQLLIDMMGLGEQCRFCNKEQCDRRDQLEKMK